MTVCVCASGLNVNNIRSSQQ